MISALMTDKLVANIKYPGFGIKTTTTLANGRAEAGSARQTKLRLHRPLQLSVIHPSGGEEKAELNMQVPTKGLISGMLSESRVTVTASRFRNINHLLRSTLLYLYEVPH